MTQVLSTGQTATHCGHIEMADALGAFLRIDDEGAVLLRKSPHSGIPASQAEQHVHCEATIL